MASCDHLFADAANVIRELIERNNEVEAERCRRVNAAVTLQSGWRARAARRVFVHLNAAATVIQKWVRGYQVRQNIIEHSIRFERRNQKEHYHKSAVKFQALWRGYALRKRKNFHREYTQKREIEKKNLEIREKMLEQMQKVEENNQTQSENEAKSMVLYIIFKLHHQLRTQTKEGIYSKHGSKNLSKIEELFASVKFTNYMKELRKRYNEQYIDKKPCFKTPFLKDQMEEINVKKPFCFNPKVCKKYEPTLDHDQPFRPAIKNIERAMDLTKNISEKDFDLTNRKVPPKMYPPPYHLDFWSLGCEIHDIEH